MSAHGGERRERFGIELCDEDRRHVLAAYIYRHTIENARAHPDCVRASGARIPLITDARWLETTCWRVRNDGRLDRRVKFCRTGR